MRIMINCSNIKIGGAVQVADSICEYLSNYKSHNFVVVLSTYLTQVAKKIADYNNCMVYTYDVRNSLATLIFGRDSFLDHLVSGESIDCVLTVFGPSRWNPRCPHVSGFARAQLICLESPYYYRMPWKEKAASMVSNKIMAYYFRRSTKNFYSENEWVSKRVESCFRGSNCVTVTNYYNQVFDCPEKYLPCPLPTFKGITILNVGANYPHKNLGITIDIAQALTSNYPELRFRFILTIDPGQFHVPDNLKDCFELIGKVDISQCPSLYEQADIMFQPSLLECFSATYPEAMRMKVPIVTTDLDFAHSLCGDAALYYSPLDAQDATDKIISVANCIGLRDRLIANGIEQLGRFDDYRMRISKLVGLCENIARGG